MILILDFYIFLKFYIKIFKVLHFKNFIFLKHFTLNNLLAILN